MAVWAWPRGREVAIRIEDGPAPAVDEAAVEAEWGRQCAANPRLFDGPILSAVRIEPGEPIRARRDSYKHLAVQPAIDCGVEQLSVTGVVMMRDESGADRVFLGRRGTQTAVYPGLWELGPSGGVEPPPLGRASLCEGDLIEQVQREFAEETGYQVPLAGVHPHALCQDLRARSCDIVFVCRVGELGEKPAADAERWEYERFDWVALTSIRELDMLHAESVIPPTRGLFRFFGWV